MNKSESIVKLAAALVKAQAEMGTAKKDSNNPFFKSKYADLNAIREAVLPALNGQNITVLQPTTTIEGRNYVETILLHESGEWISGYTEIKEVRNNNPQDNGSGTTYARRFGLQSMTNCGAEDDDGEASAKVLRHQPAKTEPAKAATPPTQTVQTQEPAKTTSSFRKKDNVPKVEIPVVNGNGKVPEATTVTGDSGWT